MAEVELPNPHELEEIKEKAEECQKESELHLRAHFPLAAGVTMFQIAIAIGAISVLTKRKAFWYFAIAFGVAGVMLLAAGMWMSPASSHAGPAHPHPRKLRLPAAR